MTTATLPAKEGIVLKHALAPLCLPYGPLEGSPSLTHLVFRFAMRQKSSVRSVFSCRKNAEATFADLTIARFLALYQESDDARRLSIFGRCKHSSPPHAGGEIYIDDGRIVRAHSAATSERPSKSVTWPMSLPTGWAAYHQAFSRRSPHPFRGDQVMFQFLSERNPRRYSAWCRLPVFRQYAGRLERCRIAVSS